MCVKFAFNVDEIDYRCPEGYYGYSCEDCALGYFRSQEGPLGPICAPCNCHGHATNCHPLTGACVTLVPASQTRPAPEVKDPAESFPEYGEQPSEGDTANETDKMFCHLMPDQCVEDTTVVVSLTLSV